jgi:manganese/iron transport system ATP-binding protein
VLKQPVLHDVLAPSIAVEHVSVAYDGKTVLHDISFQFQHGLRVAVVGPNGAGKTTLFRVLAGVLKPQKGQVRVFGHDPDCHVCIAYVPQRSQVDWAFPVTVAEVVMMGRVRKMGFLRWPSRGDWETVQAALERVGMQELQGRGIGQLSGGQQQRVFLARAIAQEAEIILLDEPLTGLDIPSQEAILGLLDEMRERELTVLVATHDLNLASEHFDQIMLLNRRIVALGPPAQVLKSQTLMEAYGSQVHLIPGDEPLALVADTCCEGEDESDGRADVAG